MGLVEHTLGIRRERTRYVDSLAGLLTAGTLWIAGCAAVGSTGHSAAPTPAAPAVSVSISPASAAVLLGNTQAFTAGVVNSENLQVSWSVNGVTGGNASLGTITAAGLYTAPEDLPVGSSAVKLEAISQADPTQSATSEVTIASDVVVALTPATASAELGAVEQFYAAIASAGHPNPAIQWSVGGACLPQCGSVDASGRFTAPQILPTAGAVMVTAQSIADPSKHASQQIPVSSSFTVQVVAPADVNAGAAATLQAILIPLPGSNPATELNWSLAGPACTGTSCGSLSVITEQSGGQSAAGQNGVVASATYRAPASVPAPTLVTVVVTPQADPAKRAQATLTIQPAGSSGGVPTVTPATATMAANRRVTLRAQSNSGAGFFWMVNGSAGGNSTFGQLCVVGSQPCQLLTGSATQVDYLAPGSIPSPNPVTVLATSAADPTKSASAQITVINHEVVTISPGSVTLAPLSAQTFSATVLGSPDAAVVWQIQSSGCSVAANCGAITANGIYTAPSAAPSPNNIQIVAISADDVSQSGTATVSLSTGANILALHPASVYAGAAEGFTLRVEGSGFTASAPGPGSSLVVAGIPRATTCATSFECTAQVSAADLAQPGNVSVQIKNGDGNSSNGVSLVVAAINWSDEVITLTTGNPLAVEKDIVVVDPTTAGVSEPGDDVDLNVAALGIFSPANNSCDLTGNPVPVQRPANGTATLNVCLYSESGLDTSMDYFISGPGDIGVIARQPAGLGIVEVTLAIPAAAMPGARSLFIQNANLDKAAASGFLEVY
jgi:hypothetical protein